MDRHLLGYAERHRRVAGRPFDLRLFLSVRATFCDRVFREYRVNKLINQKKK